MSSPLTWTLPFYSTLLPIARGSDWFWNTALLGYLNAVLGTSFKPLISAVTLLNQVFNVPSPPIQPTISVTPTDLELGDIFTVAGSGFTPHGQVTIYRDTAALWMGPADSMGTFSQSFTVAAFDKSGLIAAVDSVTSVTSNSVQIIIEEPQPPPTQQIFHITIFAVDEMDVGADGSAPQRTWAIFDHIPTPNPNQIGGWIDTPLFSDLHVSGDIMQVQIQALKGTTLYFVVDIGPGEDLELGDLGTYNGTIAVSITMSVGKDSAEVTSFDDVDAAHPAAFVV